MTIMAAGNMLKERPGAPPGRLRATADAGNSGRAPQIAPPRSSAPA